MADRHPAYIPPAEPATPPTMAEAEANATAVLEAAWVRRFHQHVDNADSTVYVDVETGVTYPAIPAMHTKDGRDT